MFFAICSFSPYFFSAVRISNDARRPHHWYMALSGWSGNSPIRMYDFWVCENLDIRGNSFMNWRSPSDNLRVPKTPKAAAFALSKSILSFLVFEIYDIWFIFKPSDSAVEPFLCQHNRTASLSLAATFNFRENVAFLGSLFVFFTQYRIMMYVVPSQMGSPWKWRNKSRGFLVALILSVYSTTSCHDKRPDVILHACTFSFLGGNSRKFNRLRI